MKALIFYKFIFISIFSSFSYSQISCISFDDTVLNISTTASQSTYPASSFYSKDSVSFYLKYKGNEVPFIYSYSVDIKDTLGTGWGINQNTNFKDHILILGDVDVKIDFSNVTYLTKKISFDFYNPGALPFSLNEFKVNGVSKTTLPAGVLYNYTPLTYGYHVEITGDINSIEIGGFETGYDNLCFEPFINTTGLTKEKHNKITVFPNPTENILTINSNNTFSDAFYYKIVGLDGRIIKLGTIESNSINVENLSKGVYLLLIKSGKDSFTTKFTKL